MAQLELTISPNYVDWSTWECLRELLQNVKDEDTKGNPMEITYYPQTERLELCNKGSLLERRHLILGETDKRSSSSLIGQYGEGFKLAWAALLRAGHAIKVHNQSETWTPSLQRSESFGADVLMVQTRKTRSGYDGVKTEIHGVTQEMWDEARGNVLFLLDKEVQELLPPYVTSRGTLLRHPDFRNKLFVKGLFVAQLHPVREHLYGYDIETLPLDRDRRMASYWEMRGSLEAVLREAIKTGALPPEEAYTILTSPKCEEYEMLEHHATSASDDYREAMAARWTEEHGVGAIPAPSYEVEYCRDVLKLPVVECTEGVRRWLGDTLGQVSKVRAKKERTIQTVHARSGMGKEERNLVDLVEQLFVRAGHMKAYEESIIIVDFWGDGATDGLRLNEDLCVSAHRATSFHDLLRTCAALLAERAYEKEMGYSLEGARLSTSSSQSYTEAILLDVIRVLCGENQ